MPFHSPQDSRVAMPEYDIVLVLSYFRVLAYYLSIIKYLSKDFNIGIYPISLHHGFLKQQKTNREFVQTCIDMGAELVETYPVSTKVAIYPQQIYTNESTQHLQKYLHSRCKIAIMTLAMPGLRDDFITDFDVKKVFVIHRAFFDFLYRHRGNPLIYKDREIVEIGLPYGKYPVFTDFTTDYILATPTPFSFPHEKDKWHFLESVSSLLDLIHPKDTVVYKPHNADEADYFSKPVYQSLAYCLKFFPDYQVCRILKRLSSMLEYKSGDAISNIYTAFLFKKVMDRVVPMNKMTPYHQFALEAFLPNVRKGVIGGLSNTIWGSLYFKIPFYNCVDISRQNRTTENTIYKRDPTQRLDLNLKFFNIPYFEGRLEFDPKYFDIIDDSARQGDLIKELKVELRQMN
jgi:hypothetical protein